MRFSLGFVVLGLILSPNSALAKEAAPSEVIELWPGVAPGSESYEGEEKRGDRGTESRPDGWVRGGSRPTLTVYLPDEEHRNGTGIVVCPGGGYGGLAIDKEGHEIARWYRDRGVVAVVLKYRHGGGVHQHPVPLSDAQRALRIVRSRAETWQIKSDRIGIMGFSAGGHLASTAGTHDDDGNEASDDPIERASCHADFMVLVYPVISMQEGLTHGGSRKNLLGEKPAAELVELLSNERQVTAKTGQTFLVHAGDDKAVPVENSWEFYRALLKHEIPAEFHVFERGGHGFGMREAGMPVDHWPALLEAWLQDRGLLAKKP